MEEKELRLSGRDNGSSEYSYIDVGYSLITPMLVGVFLGLYVDRQLGTKPFCMIALLLLGCILGFYQLFRLTKKEHAAH